MSLKRLILACTMGMLALAGVQPTWAQQTIRGTVTDSETNEPLPGVNVQVVGTTIGTATSSDGTYELSSVPAEADTLAFSFIGYGSERVAISGRSVIDVQLTPRALEAEGVIVTALGVEREERSLGYATEDVDGADVAQVEQISVANALAGRVAGLKVSQSGSGPGGSSRVVLRGSSSLSGDSQALIVVDGIPIDNSVLQPAGRFGGFDYGDGIGDIPPNSIESVSVLKGPNAAALYGSRAANGAIVITTKKGRGRDGIGVSFSSSLSFEEPAVWMDEEFQNIYGRAVEEVDGQLAVLPGAESSFGPRMEGQSVQRFNGTVSPYSPQSDNIRDFYETGTTLSNTISFAQGGERASFRLSYTNLQNQGILPDHELDRNSFFFAGTADLTDRLSATGRVIYTKRETFNRPNLTDNPDNTIYGFLFMPRSVRLGDLQPFQTANGQPIVWNNQVPGRRQNPYWTVNLNTNDDERDRLLGLVSTDYDFTDWLNVQARAATDLYTELRRFRRANNTVFEVGAAPSRALFQETRIRVEEINADVLASARHDLNDDFYAELSAGGSYRRRETTLEGFTGNGLSVPNFFVRSNAVGLAPFVDITDEEVQSLYAFGQIAFRDYLFLDLTARNDWSSTLPEDNWSFFYPSASLSFILSDVIDVNPNVLSFAKLRASVAEVGDDVAPYQLNPTLVIGGSLGGSFGGQNYASVSDALANADLEPELTTSAEIGADLRFLSERLGLNVTYYTQNTRNQNIIIPISSGSGFSARSINAGEVLNRGVELQLKGTPIARDDLMWDVSFNFATNNSEVRDFPGDITTQILGTSRSGVQVIVEEGEPFGNIIGDTFLRDENGAIVVDENGLPMAGERSVLGNYQADWTGGLSSTLSYRGASLGFLFDIQRGGEIYSLSNVIVHGNGNHTATLRGREDDGFIVDGVKEDGTPNDIVVTPQAYWSTVAAFPDGAIDEAFIYDASYIRLRELTLGYEVPTRLFGDVPIQRLQLTLIGQNLFFLERHTDGFNPAAYTRTNSSGVQGLEYAAFPNTRSLGFKVNLEF